KGYDVKGALSSLNIGSLKNLSYTRDNVGNITAINDLIDSTKTKTYAYDVLYRLTQATQGTTQGTATSSIPHYQGGTEGGVNPSTPYSISYSYDPVGNRTVETSSDGTTNYSYSANKLTASSGAKTYTFSYDNNGNTVTDNQKTYIYNQNQRLIKAVENGDTLGEYVYNANGQRVKKTVDGKVTYYLYDQSGNLIEEADETGQINADYIYLGSVPIARVDEWWEGMILPEALEDITAAPGDTQLTVSWNANAEPVDGYKVYYGTQSGNYTNLVDVGKTTSYTITGLTNGTTYYVSVTAYADIKETLYYHTDHLGTPILMTDKSGAVVWEKESLPFGEEYSLSGSIANNLGFPGQYFDKETGLYYNWHRYYKTDIGRYMSFDPILRGLSRSDTSSCAQSVFGLQLKNLKKLNPFIYTDSNPINFIDPKGLACGTPWLDFLIPDTWTTDIDFTQPCTNHDKCYGTCGKSKSQCDNTFCNELLDVCGKAYLSDKDACNYLAKKYCNAMDTVLAENAYKKAQKRCCASGSW
ncbi:MAG: fibronectin type III domain-containing protein, partial [Nitrospirae bacterium]|nr:fibronectin type III domain-containing protein [Nitrospirota bacterium]